MGAITEAMSAACRGVGVDIRTNIEVREVVVEKDRAAGVITTSGEVFRARAVVSNLNPKLLYDKLVDHSLLPGDFRARMRDYRCASGTFRMNVALPNCHAFPVCLSPATI